MNYTRNELVLKVLIESKVREGKEDVAIIQKTFGGEKESHIIAPIE